MSAYLYIKERKRRRRRICWILRRPQFGLYDQLMVELRREDETAFINFMSMPPEMFDELLHCISPRITKQHTSQARRIVEERRGLYMDGGHMKTILGQRMGRLSQLF